MLRASPIALGFFFGVCAMIAVVGRTDAQSNCFQTPGPNVICGDNNGIANYASVGEPPNVIDAFSVGSTHCNIGTQNVQWVANSPNHPVIAQHMYRYKMVDGVSRMEQIGLSWVTHCFTTLTGNLCCTCNGQGGSVLGVGCSDPHTSGRNGFQLSTLWGLGPRNEVNPHSGVFTWPYTFRNIEHIPHTSITRRLQVKSQDLDPALNPGALYFTEIQYIARDDAHAHNQDDNASYRRITISNPSAGAFTAAMMGSTQRSKPAIRAWKVNDPNVVEIEFETLEHPNTGDDTTGYAKLAVLVKELPNQAGGGGAATWHYEYALHNLNSHRGFASLAIPFHAPHIAAVTDIGFHDVDYHSGDGYNSSIDNVITFDGTDWPATISNDGGGQLKWQLIEDARHGWQNSNALRWGTTYNFRFRTNRPPAMNGSVKIGMFLEGPADAGDTIQLQGIPVPQSCPADIAPTDLSSGFAGDGIVNADDLLALLQSWGQCGDSSDCPADLAPPGSLGPVGDGNVDIDDLLVLLQSWGQCWSYD